MHFCFKSWAKETWSDFRLWFDFEIQIWITFQIWKKNPSCSLSKTKKNGNLTELPNLMRFPQFGSISHKFTVGRGHFLCPSSHIVNIFIMVRDAGTCQVAKKGELGADHRQGTAVALWNPLALHQVTGSAVSPPESLFPSCSCKMSCQLSSHIGYMARGRNSRKKLTVEYIIIFSHENKIQERVLTHNKDEGSFFITHVQTCSKWQLYFTTCLVSQQLWFWFGGLLFLGFFFCFVFLGCFGFGWLLVCLVFFFHILFMFTFN